MRAVFVIRKPPTPVRLDACSKSASQHRARQALVDRSEHCRHVGEALRRRRIVVAGHFKNRANVIHREAVPQQQDGADESDGDWIEVQTCPRAMNRIVLASEGPAEGLAYPFSMRDNQIFAAVADSDQRCGDDCLFPHPLLGFVRVGLVRHVLRPFNRCGREGRRGTGRIIERITDRHPHPAVQSAARATHPPTA